MFRVIYLSTNDIILSLSHPQPNCKSKVCLLSEFLLTCQYIVQSGKCLCDLFTYLNKFYYCYFCIQGNFPKVVNSLRAFLNDPVFTTLHKTIMTLSMVYPLLVLHWVQLIGLLDYDSIVFWKSLFTTNSTDSQ